MNKTLAIHAAARAKGLNPGELHLLSEAEYNLLAISATVRTRSEVIRDGIKREMSIYRTEELGIVVPITIERKREQGCRTACPAKAFGYLAGGVPVCHRCTCAGRGLRAKWRDPDAACPLPPELRVWDVYDPSSPDEAEKS